MNITDPCFQYVPSHKTDITQTFKRVGWVAPSERMVNAWNEISKAIDRKKEVDMNDPVIRALIELETKQ